MQHGDVARRVVEHHGRLPLLARRPRPAGWSTPATTCALVMTRSGAYTKPEPSTRRAQDGATPVIFTTDGRTAATARLRSSAGPAPARPYPGRHQRPEHLGEVVRADGVAQRGVERAHRRRHHVVDAADHLAVPDRRGQPRVRRGGQRGGHHPEHQQHRDRGDHRAEHRVHRLRRPPGQPLPQLAADPDRDDLAAAARRRAPPRPRRRPARTSPRRAGRRPGRRAGRRARRRRRSRGRTAPR